MRPHRAQRGFSLIEIMIGIVIGMISIVIVLQVFSRSDAAKRITNAGDDAQVNATMALNIVSRQMRDAGQGFNAFNILGCDVSYTTTTDTATVTVPLAPVTINSSLIPAGDSNTDTVLVVSGTANGPTEGDATTAESTAGSYAITTPSAFTQGDYIVAAESTRPSTCSLTLDKVTAISGSTLTVSKGQDGLASGSIVYDLGSSVVLKAYAIRNGNLTECDYGKYDCGSSSYTSTLNSDVWVPMVSNVVSLRAQYGRDTSGISGSTSKMTGVADTWDQTTPGSAADSTSIATYCRWVRVVGVRAAVVGRSLHYDKDKPTSVSPTWTGSTDAAVDLSSLTDWEYHRYKLLESAVPMRNMIWQGSQTTYQGGSGGC